jgi:hypothetical protein
MVRVNKESLCRETERRAGPGKKGRDRIVRFRGQLKGGLKVKLKVRQWN